MTLQTLWLILALLSACGIGFAIGVIVGIVDCKRMFGIPKGAVGVDENGYIYS